MTLRSKGLGKIDHCFSLCLSAGSAASEGACPSTSSRSPQGQGRRVASRARIRAGCLHKPGQCCNKLHQRSHQHTQWMSVKAMNACENDGWFGYHFRWTDCMLKTCRFFQCGGSIKKKIVLQWFCRASSSLESRSNRGFPLWWWRRRTGWGQFLFPQCLSEI